MNRLLAIARAADAPDRQLLDRFLAGRDEAAFAELVRRHGRVVWGTCHRRLANPHDAEDAFQATFLVLLRRAARLAPDTPLGPWLHRVAALTARNVRRGNRRRAAVAGPLTHDVPAPAADPGGLDLDAVLLALPERYRAPVVLCHLEGLSRREAAARLGCPEGTLSSLLSRALARLRARLGGAPALLAAAGVVVVPAGLTAAAVRTAAAFTTSSLAAAGVSPAVAGLTDGVLRMLWVKKLTAAGAALLVAGGLVAGLAVRSGGTAQATVPLAAAPQAPAEDPAERLRKELDGVAKLQAELKRREEATRAELDRLAAARKERDAVAEVGAGLVLVINHVEEHADTPPYTVRQVVGGKVREVHCSDAEALALFLGRTFADPKAPKGLRVAASELNAYREQVRRVFEVCAAAGYRRVTFASTTPGTIRPAEPRPDSAVDLTAYLLFGPRVRTPPKTTTTEVDLAATDKVDLSGYHPKP
ncbi:MAG: hypothetical protein C0501_00115 [Isosphaera sp.]|nr:hypothetical protein [Isosphaera sp.]